MVEAFAWRTTNPCLVSPGRIRVAVPPTIDQSWFDNEVSSLRKETRARPLLARINDTVGEKVSNAFSSMITFYIVAILVLVPLIWQRPQGIVGWMQYAIAVVFQGTALPILGYVARKAGESQDKLLGDTHEKVIEELKLIKQELGLAKQERQDLQVLVKQLREHRPDNR
jgi:hypothetical protein